MLLVFQPAGAMFYAAMLPVRSCLLPVSMLLSTHAVPSSITGETTQDACFFMFLPRNEHTIQPVAAVMLLTAVASRQPTAMPCFCLPRQHSSGHAQMFAMP